MACGQRRSRREQARRQFCQSPARPTARSLFPHAASAPVRPLASPPALQRASLPAPAASLPPPRLPRASARSPASGQPPPSSQRQRRPPRRVQQSSKEPASPSGGGGGTADRVTNRRTNRPPTGDARRRQLLLAAALRHEWRVGRAAWGHGLPECVRPAAAGACGSSGCGSECKAVAARPCSSEPVAPCPVCGPQQPPARAAPPTLSGLSCSSH